MQLWVNFSHAEPENELRMTYTNLGGTFLELLLLHDFLSPGSHCPGVPDRKPWL